MNELIRQALDNAGYHDMAANEENLRECFKDYVDTGTWSNLDLEDVDDLSVNQMIKGLMSLK